MSDWTKEQYTRLNSLAGKWLPENKYVSINDNHGMVSLTLAFHITPRDPNFTQDKLGKINVNELQKFCPNITLISKKRDSGLNFRKNGDNKWLYRTGSAPLDADGNQIGVESYFESYCQQFGTTYTTKRRSIGSSGGGGEGSSHNTPQTTQQKRQKTSSSSSPGSAQNGEASV